MQVTITADAVIKLAALLGALGTLAGMAFACFRFLERDRRQGRELNAIREEQTLICYGVLACLKGLKEQGCNGPVRDALDKLEKHLNQAAHKEEL